jgi:hypothetical protein
VHFRALQQRVFPMLNQMAAIQPASSVPPQMMNSATMAVQHGEAHLDMLLQSKAVKQKDIAPEIQALKQAQQILAKIAQQTEQEQAAAQQQQQAAAQAQASNIITQVTQNMRQAGHPPERVLQAALGGALPMGPPQPGTNTGGPVPNPPPLATMATGGNPPAMPNPFGAAPPGAG